MVEIHPHFKRILLKLSGEALMGKKSFGIHHSVLDTVASEIHQIHRIGVEIGIVIGGGNIFRGLQSDTYNINRITADHMGMLATVLNALALGDALRRYHIKSSLLTAIQMPDIAEAHTTGKANQLLTEKHVVLFGAGTGNPLFTTDTAAVLRAGEINADIVLKATRVDGVYDADPEKKPSARQIDKLTYRNVIENKLKVMDLTSITLAMELNIPLIVFNLKKLGNIVKVISGEKVGTLITGE